MDAVLRRAVHPNPRKRQEALSEFVHDLRQPSAAYLGRARPALYERNPMVFWRAIALVLGATVVALLAVIQHLR